MIEEWKDIPEYEGLYQVSNLGNVKSLKFGKQKLLKPQINSRGYYQVRLWKNSKGSIIKVHQLVAMSFLNHIRNGLKLVVNHIDLDKTNNHIHNLEVITQRENANMKHIKTSSSYVGVCWDKSNNKWKSSITINGKLKHLGLFESELDASNAYQEIYKTIK